MSTAENTGPYHGASWEVPDLKALLPRAGLIALFLHVAALAAYFLSPTAEMPAAGGGGQVLGTLSMTLAGAADSVEEDAPVETAKPPVAEPVKQEPRKPRETVRREVTPPVTQPRPQVRPRPLPVPRVTQPVTPPRPAPAAPPPTESVAESAPAPAARAASPTIGAGAAAPVSGAAGGEAATASDLDAYLAIVRQRIERERRYPSSARRAGVEGTATVALEIGSDGSLVSHTITRGSGSFDLDRAAQRMVRRAAPFPTPPSTPFRVTLPIEFALGR